MPYFQKILPVLFLFIYGFANAQPNTEIYLFDLKREKGNLVIDNMINISSNEGYDNQPSFWSDSKSVLYARTINGQTDIARYSINTRNTEIISNTAQGSEYSPTLMRDKRISSIQLDTTGLQLLYAYDLQGKNEVLVDELVIGYHAWLHTETLVAFVLGEPATMQIINTASGDAEIVAENIGRSLHKIPSSKNFSYVDKSESKWTINNMNPLTKEIEILTSTLIGSEDYAWASSKEIVMGKGSKLYLWSSGQEWSEIADLSKYNIFNISRVAISNNGKKIALVGQ